MERRSFVPKTILTGGKLPEIARGARAQGVVQKEQDAATRLPVYLDLELWEEGHG